MAEITHARVLETAPDHIWLDIGDELHFVEPETIFRDLADSVTWSEDNATGCGIKYVRAQPDHAGLLRQALEALLNARKVRAFEGGTVFADDLELPAIAAIRSALATTPGGAT